MTAAHTPGPWKAVEYRKGVIERICGGHKGVQRIAAISLHDETCTSPDSQGESNANARLIAAAPELLEALNGLLAYVEQFGTHTNDRRVTAARFTALEAVGAMDVGSARAAIAKAEGRA